MNNRTWCISTNKLLYSIFSYTYSDTEIKSKSTYVRGDDGKRQYTKIYYVEFDFEEFKGNLSKVRISSNNIEDLRFSIYEQMLYYMLISNARQSNNKDNYHISMRKLRSIRGLQGDSINTYKCYEKAIYKLSKKNIMVLPVKSTYKQEIIDSNMLSISNIVKKGDRICDFYYSFNKFDKNLVQSRQKFDVTYNPFKFIFKKYYSFLFCLHMTRLIALNYNSGITSRRYSLQKILLELHKINGLGIIENVNYYKYIEMAGNKQSAYLKKCLADTENILKLFVKHKYIKNYNISTKSTFKYLKDNEVYIEVKFIK